MLRTFLCIGAQKAGTTSLHGSLAQHPEVYVTAEKELNFFCDPGYEGGIDWYQRQFSGVGDAIARCEVSPQNTSFPLKQLARSCYAMQIEEWLNQF